MPTLSKREKTVLELIAEGLSSPEIAERLHLSGRTVEWHSAKVMNKLGAKNRIQAVVIAIRNQIIHGLPDALCLRVTGATTTSEHCAGES